MKISFIILLSLIAVCLSININIQEPELTSIGFKTALSQSGLDYLNGVGISLLEQVLKTVTVPDQSGDADTPIGHVDWTLSSIALSQLSLPSNSIALVPGVGLSLVIDQMSVDLTASWKYRKNSWPHLSDHGTADILLSSTNIQVDLAVTAANGRPVVAVASDGIQIGHLDIKLHGGASWLYDFFIKILGGDVRKAIEKALNDAITQNVNKGANAALATLPITQKINSNVEINFEILSDPIFTSTYLSVPESGEFYEISNPTECPTANCPVDNLPDDVNTEMLQMIIGDYVANSAGYVFLETNALKVSVVDSQIPSNSPIRLNTTFWKYILPQLYAAYPDNLMVINIYATESPATQFVPTGANVQAVGELEVFVVLENGNTAPAFILSGFVSTSAQALITGQTIYAKLTYDKSSFSLKTSFIGTFDPTVLIDLFNLLMQEGVVPAVNAQLKQGFALPTVQGLTFESPSLSWGTGYLAISTNIQYNPPQ